MNSIKTDLRLTREKGNTQTDVYGRPVSAWSIPTSSKATTKFASKGDSGSLILDDDKTIIGLLFAANPACGTGYFIPFQVIIADIDAVTGAKVVNLSEA